MTVYNIYDQLADLISGLAPEKVTSLKATEELQNRFDILVEHAKNERLTKQQKDELDYYVVLERLISLAKIRSYPLPK